ncbi:Protein transport protein bet1, partial [Leucoagaricus sp. SymC.cos]
RLSSNTSLRDRSALLGPSSQSGATLTPPGSGRSTPSYYNNNSSDTSLYGGQGHGGGSFPSGHRYADDLEGQNDEALESLSAKVKLLKDITIGIGNEVRESTKQLGQMNDAFSETGGILQGTFRRMNNMSSKQGCRWLWYIVFLIVVFWFFIVVWWFRR